MPATSQQFSISVIGRRAFICVVFVWPSLLVLTWLFLLLLSYINGVLNEIPLELRQGITGAVPGDVPGFLQDPYYTIFQFFWLPFIWLLVRSFRLLPITICTLWDQKIISHEMATDELVLNNLVGQAVTEFNQKMLKFWPWILGTLVGIGSMSNQVLIQVNRIECMDTMHWWDWRISSSIYIVRLLMVGLDMALATVIVIKGLQVIVFVRKFLAEFKFLPQPFHPDGVGGLASISKLCLSFIFPIMVAVIVLATSFMFHREQIYWITNLVISFIYVPVIIFVFFYPLEVLHSKLKNFRAAWLNCISLEINHVLLELNVAIKSQSNTSSSQLYSNLDSLNRYYQTVEKLPVWPFDLTGISKLLGAILLPVITVALGKIIEHFIT